MSKLKKEVISFIKDLPDNTTLEEIIYHLRVKEGIERALKQNSNGKEHTHQEVMKSAKKRLKEKWLK